MYHYNITFQDLLDPGRFTKGCHLKADNVTELSLLFSQKYPTGEILGLVKLDN